MINTQMNNNEGFFCIRRRHYCLLLLWCFIPFLKAQIYISDSTLVKVENGALLYDVPSEKVSPNTGSKIYVFNGAIIKNNSEISNTEIVYIDKKQEEPQNYVEKQTKKAKQEIQKKDLIVKDEKFCFTTNQNKNVFQSFVDSGGQSIVPIQNLPTQKAIRNENSFVLIEALLFTNLFYYQIRFHNVSFNSYFSIRPPPSFLSI